MLNNSLSISRIIHNEILMIESMITVPVPIIVVEILLIEVKVTVVVPFVVVDGTKEDK